MYEKAFQVVFVWKGLFTMSYQALMADMAIWIKDSHHQDGCVRRHYPYPQKKKKLPCDCGKEDVINRYEKLNGVTVGGNKIIEAPKPIIRERKS